MMKPSSFKITSVHLLLCVLLTLLSGVTDSSSSTSDRIMATASVVPSTTKPSPPDAKDFKSARQTPENVKDVKVLTQTESSITLTWNKTNDISTYWLQYNDNGSPKAVKINAPDEGTSVTHVVSPLTAGTKYNFTLFTEFEGVNSSGPTFEACTVPPVVSSVNVTERSVTSITLEWSVDVNKDWSYFLQMNGESLSLHPDNSKDFESHSFTSLQPRTKYPFSVITEFCGLNSTAYEDFTLTDPENVKAVEVLTQTESSITLRWNKTNDISTYWLQYHNNSYSNEVKINSPDEGTSVKHVVSPLTAGTKYIFTLFTVFEGLNSTGYTTEACTVPPVVSLVSVTERSVTSITLAWSVDVDKDWSYFLQMNGESLSLHPDNSKDFVSHSFTSLQPETKYLLSVITQFCGLNSTTYENFAVTVPENVKDVEILTQTESSITLRWNKTNDISTYRLQYNDKSSFNTDKINASDQGTPVTHVVSPLTAGTFYYFTLFTVLEGVNSTGYTFQNVTAPENVEAVEILTQNESSITLMWNKTNDISTYWLQYNDTGIFKAVEINASDEGTLVTHVVSPLTAGRKYNFTLFTVFEGVNSTGYTTEACTVPPAVSSVSVTERSVTSITLEWSVDVDKDWSYFLQMNGESLSLQPNNSKDFVSHSFTSLQHGTKYPFSVITEFCGLKSTAYEDFTLTAIDCASVNWHVTNSSIQGMIDGLFTNAAATDESQVHLGMITDSNVTFTGLDPGATYKVSLVYEENSRSFNQCLPEPLITTNPPNLIAGCEYWAAGYSVNVAWNKPAGVWTAVEVKVSGETHNEPVQDGKQNMIIHGFLPARTYEVSVASLSGNRRSDPYVFPCLTDPRGVIAGSVIAVLIFCLLIFLIVFILLKRPDIFRTKKPFSVGFRLSKRMCKAISLAKFPQHFHHLSGDDNRGFTQEYESLIPVGTEQAQKEALLPENNARNRLNHILPYDWCRVKLHRTTSNPNVTSDYINASYIPGYSSNREYIATQGPLPSTVSDFWRMIWEQRVKAIVMVTNCTEGGQMTCEQYWPADGETCLHKNLMVTTHSQQREPNWTLRDVRVKHMNTSEERTVRHFHFTAWPEHGVPQGTGVLIQFRGLVREHIEREGAGAPTVVHCSGGGGRTGTIIALDVLLQQLDKDNAVGINSFVHKMRLSRPHMVQTEAQYVFLHQCIMDCLEPNETTEEHVYENPDLLYANVNELNEVYI